MSKFGTLNEAGDDIPFQYPNLFYIEPLSIGNRMTVGPRNKHIPLILELTKTWASKEYYVLYVLLLSHTGNDQGRYQSPLINCHEDLELFLYTFQEFFEGDGRHHIWVMSPHDEGMLIYDQHNVIYAYGELEKYKQILVQKGYTEKEFSFPVPHTHRYPGENAVLEDELFEYYSWQKFPLEDGDEY